MQFYDGDLHLVENVSSFIADGLIAVQSCIIIATTVHVDAILVALARRGFDVARKLQSEQLRSMDARATLDSLMTGDDIDIEALRAMLWPLFEHGSARSPRAPVRAHGEMVDLLAQGGNFLAAMSIEVLWNELAAARLMELLCGYGMTSFEKLADRASFDDVCSQHEHVLPNEMRAHASRAQRLLEIARLQQSARPPH